jgi:hypothetical protein
MRAYPLGKIVVATPGTPIQVSTLPPTPACCRIRFEMPAGNTNGAFVGVAGLVGSTLTNCIKQLVKPTAGAPLDAFEIADEDSRNTLHIADYWVDVTTASDGVLVTYWQQ